MSHFLRNHKPVIIIAVAIISFIMGFLLLIVVQAMLAARGGVAAFTGPSSAPVTFGSSEGLKYVVIGDSTAAGQGAPYEEGIAIGTSKALSRTSGVTLQNFGVSGAVLKEVQVEQVPKAKEVTPDLVLVSAGANDVTHLTRISSMRESVKEIIRGLREANPEVQVVLTGSPQMGSIPRFAQPLRFVAELRTAQVNSMFKEVAREEGVVFAPLAELTGDEFKRNPELFAEDNFHPNAEGYGVWTEALAPYIIKASKQ